MTYIIFHQSTASVRDARPWPVVVDDEGEIVHGRPDARRLIGFGPAGEQRVTILTRDALTRPEDVVGLVPTFSNLDGMFSVEQVVESCRTYVVDDVAVERLRDAERAMRRAIGGLS